MELTNKKLEAVEGIANETLQNQLETISKEKVERVKSFKDFGFKRAGQNLGSWLSLKTHLNWIRDGHFVDETYNENEVEILRQQAENKILSKDEEKEKIEGDKKTAIEVLKPSIERKIKDLNDEIQQTRIDLADKTLQTGYESIKFIMYSTLVVILSFYLLFFYASTIYAAFFRNKSSLIANAGGDISLYLDSIFDVKGIFTASPILLIVYLGAFLFFAIGLIPHNIEGKNKSYYIGLSLFGALVADSMLAYKIDKGLHDLKIMAGISDGEWYFYTSINFYLVLLFGFAAYLVWGYMFEMMLKEKTKKSPDIKANIIIKGLKEEISLLRIELSNLETRIIELETQLKAIMSQLEQLKKELEKRMQNPDALSQNLTSFYMGWQQYLNNTTEFINEKDLCEQTFNEFIQSQFHLTVSAN
ncbi:coiled-coil domain-containing protein [Flavobacterium aciduliphilum]|uniref:Uncharacterized protein n=1 Tax=Flavobacterium aciduliphilum TaxID=1101402 RepID=A0A328YLL7_9FLAO|nr:hypothetical protein [Flavobacterium aciduliphilum]RAR71487.1 hypothetical protein CLV55_10743 [Flavobacterium aciduliphilum]